MVWCVVLCDGKKKVKLLDFMSGVVVVDEEMWCLLLKLNVVCYCEL